MKFIIPDSNTPIYQTIIDNISESLKSYNHFVEHISSSYSNDLETLINDIENYTPDYVLITNFSNILTIFLEEHERFVYELLNVPIIFIHHDNIFHGSASLIDISYRLNSYKTISKNSYHFCLENDDYLFMREYGFENIFPINHASEFTNISENIIDYSYDVTFIGHVIASNDHIYDGLFGESILKSAYWKKACIPGCKNIDHIEQFQNYAKCFLSSNINKNDRDLLFKYYFINQLHIGSQPFRGAVLRELKEESIQIFGGDPSYLHGKEFNRNIDNPNFSYHKPTTRNDSKGIFASSKININITSLQFNTAVINRIIDVFLLGGFILTDRKDGLRNLTSAWEDISYTDIPDLKSKIDFFLTNEKVRKELSNQITNDFSKKCSYRFVVQYILDSLSPEGGNIQRPKKLDLGCGPRKKEGFIGVDIDAGWPSIDVVADLTKKIPYPDNSIDEIRAHDLIEHLPDRINTMNEIWRVCKDGALVDIRVPSTDGRGAFQDPTHISFWNINSFNYYSVEHPAYLELCHSYGFTGSFKIIKIQESSTPDGVVHVNVILKTIKSVSFQQVQ